MLVVHYIDSKMMMERRDYKIEYFSRQIYEEELDNFWLK